MPLCCPRSLSSPFSWGQEGSEMSRPEKPGIPPDPQLLCIQNRKKKFFFFTWELNRFATEKSISMETALILALLHLMPTLRVRCWVRAQGMGRMSRRKGSERVQSSQLTSKMLWQSKWSTEGLGFSSRRKWI